MTQHGTSSNRAAVFVGIFAGIFAGITTADGCDRKQLERICRYLLRPPFAHDAVTALPGGRVRVSGRRLSITPCPAATRRQPRPDGHAAPRTLPPRIGNIGVQTANVAAYRRDQVP